MKALLLTGLTLAIAAAIALPLAGAAEAAIGGALPSTEVLPIEKAQFFFGGQNYCWYDSGWQGPGWYWCGYAWNNGQGWGGGEGWHGWSRGSHAAAPRAPSHVVTKYHVGVASHVSHVSHVSHARPSGGGNKKP
jgi:hypothetical protein